MMRYFLGIVPAILLVTSCAPTATITEEQPGEMEITGVPDWYDERIYSDSDSLSFHGFAMASAVDSARAVQLSEQTAIENLRFEVDRHTDYTRQLLAEEGEGTYGSVSFIINLRNAVQELNLIDSELTYEHETSEDGIHYVYARATISRQQVLQMLSQYISDGSFINQLQADR